MNSTPFSQESAQVLSNEQTANGVFLMRLEVPGIAAVCRPAHFVQIQTDVGLSPFLRRPLSILRSDRTQGWVEVLYDVIGPGTQRLSATVPGDRLDLLGPLGRPFDPPDCTRLLLVAGGVGIVPLAFLAWDCPDLRSSTVFLMGAANRDRMPEVARLLPDGLELHLATDDGSLGYEGFVTELIEPNALPDMAILTCGPHRMMARTAAIARELDVPCYASMENHMACGFGACVGCVVERVSADREDLRYQKVCVDGPVVNAHEIVW